ncbi:MAG: hypothetical protein PHR31_02870 [Candidatus Pacebacteria bacterium]|nr:hypothetical protein [Candidatus Paceibacterota bacterium]
MQLKKIIAGILMLAIGLFAGGGLALAQPYYYWWPPNESISVSVSPQTPTGTNTHCDSGTLCNLGIFRAKAAGGSIRLTEMKVRISGTGSIKIESLALYNNAGNIISNQTLYIPLQDNVSVSERFTMDITIPANDIADIFVKGIVTANSDSATINVSLSSAEGPSIIAIGQRGNQIYSYASLSLPTIYIEGEQQWQGRVNLSKTQTNATALIAVPYKNVYRLSNEGEAITLDRVEVTASNPNVRILGMALLSDGRNFSRLIYPYSGYYDNMSLYLSGWKEKVVVGRGSSKVIEILVYANGITNFQGKIYATSGSRAIEIPFYVTYR